MVAIQVLEGGVEGNIGRPRGGGILEKQMNADKGGEGVKKSENSADVF